MSKRKRKIHRKRFVCRREICLGFILTAVVGAVLWAAACVSAMEYGGFDVDVGAGESWDYPNGWNEQTNDYTGGWGDVQSGNGYDGWQNNGYQDNNYQDNNYQNNGFPDNNNQDNSNQDNGYQGGGYQGNGYYQGGYYGQSGWSEGTWSAGGWQAGGGFGNNPGSYEGNYWQWDSQGNLQGNMQGNIQDGSWWSGQQDGYQGTGSALQNPAAQQPVAGPKPTEVPKPTVVPKPTARPKSTAKPKPTVRPKLTITPKPTITPKLTSAPKPTSALKPTVTPRATPDSQFGSVSESTATHKSRGVSQGQDAGVSFVHADKPDARSGMRIKLEGTPAVQILSLRYNGSECAWHWEGDSLVLDADIREKGNCVELLAVIEDGRLVSMEPWLF